MKADYDAVSAERRARLHCCVAGSRLFAAKLLLIVMLPVRVDSAPLMSADPLLDRDRIHADYNARLFSAPDSRCPAFFSHRWKVLPIR